MNASVAILVLGYRARQQLEEGSLASVVDAAQKISGHRVQLVYLDNYSRDGSVEWILRNHPEIDLLLSPSNALYCAGTNTLLRYAYRRYSPSYVILVDADNFAEPDAFSALVDFANGNRGHGIVQPLVRSRRDPAQLYSCGHFFTPDHWCRTLTALPARSAELLDLPSCSISCTLVRTSVLQACGLLDPVYEIYYESADLAFRARARGYRCACAVDAVTYNKGTSGEGVDSVHHRYYFNRNRLLFWKIHDARIFDTVVAECRRRWQELEGALERSEFGLDATAESVRRGLRAGLDRVEDPAFLPRPLERIEAFDKTAAILLSEGTPIA